MKKIILAMAAVAMLVSSCCQKNENTMKEYAKKYTNADFYKDGKFQQDVALKAYQQMFDFYGIEYTPTLTKDMWITDFGLGDFENVGMAGIFWVNDSTNCYFGHDIYLLPNQMIPEHRHVATATHPAKFESWRVQKGNCYNFSIGEPTANAPVLPASQKEYITSLCFVAQGVDEVIHLKQVETPHFLLAGDKGAVVSEFATYHDNAGLRFTNPTAAL